MLLAARAGSAEGYWLRAAVQDGGRGRSGRHWMSPPGNLYVSTLIRLADGDPEAASLSFVAAVALEEAVSVHLGPGRAVLKWPNDLLVDGAKLAGILLEREGNAIVAGFGVNLAHYPEGLDRPVTSLQKVAGHAPDPAQFAEDLAVAFRHWLSRWRSEGLVPIRQRWQERAHPVGTALSVHGHGGQRVDGVFAGLDDTGALVLRGADGVHHLIHAGDVFLI